MVVVFNCIKPQDFINLRNIYFAQGLKISSFDHKLIRYEIFYILYEPGPLGARQKNVATAVTKERADDLNIKLKNTDFISSLPSLCDWIFKRNHMLLAKVC